MDCSAYACSALLANVPRNLGHAYWNLQLTTVFTGT